MKASRATHPLERLLAPLLLILLLGVLPAGASQEAESPAQPSPPQVETQIYRLQHVTPSDVRQILHMLRIRFTPDERLNAVIVADTAEKQALAKEVIGSLDVPLEPGVNLEITVSILEASPEPLAEKVPEHLAGVVEQLSSVFGFAGARVRDSILLRVSDGGNGRVDGGISVGPHDGYKLGYQLGFERARLQNGAEGRSIRLERLRFEAFEIVEGTAITRASMRTDVDLEEGQTAVVGKATPMQQGGTLVLVVNARAID